MKSNTRKAESLKMKRSEDSLLQFYFRSCANILAAIKANCATSYKKIVVLRRSDTGILGYCQRVLIICLVVIFLAVGTSPSWPCGKMHSNVIIRLHRSGIPTVYFKILYYTSFIDLLCKPVSNNLWVSRLANDDNKRPAVDRLVHCYPIFHHVS